MRVVAGNSIANVTFVTPGGAGVTQAFNVASLNGIISADNATAYSVAQELVTTAEHRGPSNRLPYAFRVRALSWFWTAKAHGPPASLPAPSASAAGTESRRQQLAVSDEHPLHGAATA